MVVPQPSRGGAVLLLRVWFEDSARHGIRMRAITRENVDLKVERALTSDQPEEIVEHVARWLAGLVRRDPPAP